MKQRNVKQTDDRLTDNGESVNPLLLDFITGTINSYIKLGGSLVSEDQYQDRLKVCRSCPYKGTVEIPLVVKTLTAPGCTECGCPFETKPRALKYFSLSKLAIVRAVCTHPDGNQWEEVDKNY